MIERRSIVWAFHGGKMRKGVVLEIVHGVATVIVGYGTGRAFDRVDVDPNSRDGVVLQLTKPTYFYARGGIAFPPIHMCTDTGRRCPPELFEKLNALRLRAKR